MEISDKANDQKLEALTTTLTAKMDSNHQSILAGLQQILLRPPPAAPSPEAVAVPVLGCAIPIPVETIVMKQSREQLALPPNKVKQDEESPGKRMKTVIGDLTEV